MAPRYRFGLLIGLVGLFLNICISGLFGLCGPFASLIAGGVAGFMTARSEQPAVKADGARAGAVSGSIAGALVLFGQLCGGLGALALLQFSGTPTFGGAAPPPDADIALQLTYYGAGFGTALCFGIFGVVLAAIAGAGAGFLATPDQPASYPA